MVHGGGSRGVVIRLRGQHADFIASDLASAGAALAPHVAEDAKCPVTLVVEGPALTHALAVASAAFADLAMACTSVICCRASPAQKAQLVAMVRAAGKVVLAVGDGGEGTALLAAPDACVRCGTRETHTRTHKQAEGLLVAITVSVCHSDE